MELVGDTAILISMNKPIHAAERCSLDIKRDWEESCGAIVAQAVELWGFFQEVPGTRLRAVTGYPCLCIYPKAIESSIYCTNCLINPFGHLVPKKTDVAYQVMVLINL